MTTAEYDEIVQQTREHIRATSFPGPRDYSRDVEDAHSTGHEEHS